MIDHLTDEQVAKLAEYREKWIGIGRSTEPAVRDKAEAAIRQIYALAGFASPEQIVWSGSPLAQALARAKSPEKGCPGSVLRVRDRVYCDVLAYVGRSVDCMWERVAGVSEDIWKDLCSGVVSSVRVGLEDSVRGNPWDDVRNSVVGSVGDSGYGQHDANWLVFIEYFREVLGLVEETERATGLIDLAKYAGWWLPYPNICWVSERHDVLKLDERGRLHCADGPAITYPDGWSIYAWHGVHVPGRVGRVLVDRECGDGNVAD